MVAFAFWLAEHGRCVGFYCRAPGLSWRMTYLWPLQIKCSQEICSSHMQQARLAQSAKHKALNLVVVGSSPTVGACATWTRAGRGSATTLCTHARRAVAAGGGCGPAAGCGRIPALAGPEWRPGSPQRGRGRCAAGLWSGPARPWSPGAPPRTTAPGGVGRGWPWPWANPRNILIDAQ